MRGLLEAHGFRRWSRPTASAAIFPSPASGAGDVRIAVPAERCRRGAPADREPSRRRRRRAATSRAIGDEFAALEARLGYRFRDRGAARARADASLARARGRHRRRRRQRVARVPRRRGARLRHRRRALSRVSRARRRRRSRRSRRRWSRPAASPALGERARPRRRICCSAAARRRPAAAARRRCSPTPARRSSRRSTSMAASTPARGVRAARAVGAVRRPRAAARAAVVGRGDYKSALQEALQARGRGLPEYRVAAEQRPRARQDVRGRGAGRRRRRWRRATGRSKKEAEQQAAQLALERFARQRELRARSPCRRLVPTIAASCGRRAGCARR